ncbi:Xylose transport system permease protein XylH [subsurface metagenome]
MKARTDQLPEQENSVKKSSPLKEAIINSIKNNVRQYTMILALLGIWIIFAVLTGAVFLNVRNLSNLFMQSATVAIVGMGMVLIIVSGNIDLSVGSVVGITGAAIGALQVYGGWGTIPTILLGLIIGVVIGLWQGYWVAYRGIPAFIVTLASMLTLRGAVLGVTHGTTIAPLHKAFKAIGQKYLPRLFFQEASVHDTSLIITCVIILVYIILSVRRRQSRIRYGFKVISLPLEILKMAAVSLLMGFILYIMISYRGIPYAILVVIVVAVILTFIANSTVFGRQIYAIGGNQEAARLSGISIKKRLLMLFVLMGALTSVAGIVFTARLGAATAQAGFMLELDAIAAAVIGGTSFSGGIGTIPGALVGAMVMASLDNGMSLLNMDVTYQQIIKGLVLLLAVYVDTIFKTKK